MLPMLLPHRTSNPPGVGDLQPTAQRGSQQGQAVRRQQQRQGRVLPGGGEGQQAQQAEGSQHKAGAWTDCK